MGTGQPQASGYPDSEGIAYPNGNAYANGAQPNGNGYGGASPYGSAPQPTFTPTFTPSTPGYQNGRRAMTPHPAATRRTAPGTATRRATPQEQSYGESAYGDNGYAPGYADGQQTAAYQAGPTFTPADQAESAQRGYWDGDPQGYDPQTGRDPREQRYTQRR